MTEVVPARIVHVSLPHSSARVSRRTVSDLVILHLGDVDENLRGGVVKRDRLENRRAVVRDRDLARRSRVEDLVHALGTEGRLDEVAQGESSDEGRETGLYESVRRSAPPRVTISVLEGVAPHESSFLQPARRLEPTTTPSH